MNNKMRLVFMGTSEFSLSALKAIHHMEDIDLVAVYTRAPKPAGNAPKTRYNALDSSCGYPYAPTTFRASSAPRQRLRTTSQQPRKVYVIT